MAVQGDGKTVRGKGIKSHSVLGGPKTAGPLFSTGNAPLRLHSWHRQDTGRIKGQLVLACLAWASEELRVQRMQPMRGAPRPDGALSGPRGRRRRGPTRAEVQNRRGRGKDNTATALLLNLLCLLCFSAGLSSRYEGRGGKSIQPSLSSTFLYSHLSPHFFFFVCALFPRWCSFDFMRIHTWH